MNTQMGVILAVFIAVIEMFAFVACAVYMMRLILSCTKKEFRRNRHIALRILMWAGYGVLAVLLPNLFYNDGITMLSLLCYYLLGGWLVYHKSPMGILYQAVYIMVIYAAQCIAIIASYLLFEKLEISLEMYPCLLGILKVAFEIIIVFIFGMVLKKRYAKDQKNLKIRGMILIPVFSMVLMFLYMIAGTEFFEKYGYGYIILFCLIALVINGCCLYFWYDAASTQELKNKLELIQRQNALTYQYYGEMEENYNQSRKIIHDIRNHMHMLEQSAKMEEAGTYFTDVYAMLNSLGLKFYCENRMLNIVLNDKCRHLKEEELSCNLGGIRLEFISDIDITTIFANLLDNALEAKKEEEGQNYLLKIRGEQIQDFTVVKISNTYDGEYRQGNSGKKGHEGLGLMNAGQAVEKYHGEMRVEHKEGIFSVTLVFPGQS